MSEQESSVFRATTREGEDTHPHVPHACNDGWVSMGVEAEDGTTEEVLYLCRQCVLEAS